MLRPIDISDIPKYTGFFEAHITVNPLDEVQSTLFDTVAKSLEIKAIQIQLSRGDSMLQPMTCSRHQGTFQKVYDEVLAIAHELKTWGFVVNRLKIEAHPDNVGVPLNSNDVIHHSDKNYFENHLKIRLDKDSNLDTLVAICEMHGAHLSRNAFKTINNGQYENFITSRYYDLGKNDANALFNELIQDIKNLDITILKQFTEYCVFDTNVNLDNNWLTQETVCQNCNIACEKNA